MDRNGGTRKVLNFQLSAEMHARLKDMAKERQRSASAEARLAIEDRLAEFEREKKAVV